MNARQNFYSSVFDVINSYKRKDDSESSVSFLSDPIVRYGLLSAVMLVSVISGMAYVYPKYMVFRIPQTNTPVALNSITSVQSNVFADTSIQPTELRISPSADTYISAKSSVNYGKGTSLVVQKNPEQVSLVSFHVPSLFPVTSASLQLAPSESGTGTVDVFVVDDFYFDESEPIDMNVSNMQGVLLKSNVPSHTSVTLDVTDYVAPDSELVIMLKANTGNATYSSREAPRGLTPVLVIQ